MLTHAPPALESDRWHRSTYFFDPDVPVHAGTTAALKRRIEIRYLVMKITEKRDWFATLEWIQSLAPHEAMTIEPVDARHGIVFMAYAVTNHDTITPEECAYLFEATRVLPRERHFPKTQSCAIMIERSLFERMEAALGCPATDR